MASASEDDSEGDLFVGFDEEDREAVAAVRQARFEARQESDSELDISDILDVSSVATADLSDFTDSEEEEETWNVDENPIRVLPFTEPTGSTSSVAEDGTAIDFFYLMFPEDLIEHIVTGMHVNVLLRNQTRNGLTQHSKKSRHFLAFMCCLGSNSCQQFGSIGAMILSLESWLSTKSCREIGLTNC